MRRTSRRSSSPASARQPLWGELVLTALFPDDTDALMLLAALESFDPELDWTQRALPQGRGPGLGTRLDGPVRAAAVRRAHLDRAVEQRTARRSANAGRRDRAPRSRPRVRLGHASDHRAVPAVAGRARPRRRAARPTRARLRLRQRHPRAGRAEARRRARGRRRQRSAGADRHARQRRTQRRRRPRSQVFLPNDEPVATYPIVVANILASALVALADTLAARVAPGGRIAMSGILAGQEDEVIARYADASTTCAPNGSRTGCASQAHAAAADRPRAGMLE